MRLRLKEVARVQIVIAQKLESLPVELLAAGLGYYVDDARVRSHGRHDKPLHHLELVNRRD